jgi:transposase-like protein
MNTETELPAAVLITDSVMVMCPACGVGQTTDDLRFFWTPERIVSSGGVRECQGCRKQFTIARNETAKIDY